MTRLDELDYAELLARAGPCLTPAESPPEPVSAVNAITAAAGLRARADEFLLRFNPHHGKGGRFASGGHGGGGGTPWRDDFDGDAEQLGRIAGSPTIDRKPLGGGQTASVMLERHADGTLVHKEFPDSDYIRAGEAQADAEVLGSLVGRAVGVNTPAVQRVGARTVRMEYVRGAVSGAELSHSQRAALYGSEQGRLIGLQDVLIANPDRNPGNWMQRSDGSIVAIDHGLAFVPTVHIPEFSTHFSNAAGNNWAATNDMSPGDMSKIRGRLDSLRSDFTSAGHDDWYDDMMGRFDAVESRAAGDALRLS